MDVEVDDPVAVAGWDSRWEVTGTARYKFYDSIWGGSFSNRVKRFRVVVEVPRGKKPKAIDFEER
jgi:hypothetical protein